MTAVISACVLKNISKLVNLGVAILILKMEENMQHFWHIMLYYFKKGNNATETQEVRCVEKVLCLIERVESGWRGFLLRSLWMTMLHGQADHLKLIVSKSRH